MTMVFVSRRKRSFAMRRAGKAIFAFLPALLAWHLLVFKPQIPIFGQTLEGSNDQLGSWIPSKGNDASALDLETDVGSAIRGHTGVHEILQKDNQGNPNDSHPEVDAIETRQNPDAQPPLQQEDKQVEENPPPQHVKQEQHIEPSEQQEETENDIQPPTQHEKTTEEFKPPPPSEKKKEEVTRSSERTKEGTESPLEETNLNKTNSGPPQNMRQDDAKPFDTQNDDESDTVKAPEELARLLKTDRAQELQKPIITKARFILYRALGNDLPPRHASGQTLENVRFILEHEPKHEGLERRWLLNRIVRAEDELMLVKLFLEHGERFTRDPIDYDEYGKIDFNLEKVRDDFLHSQQFANLDELRQGNYIADILNDKNQYVVHNNQARNKMLELGLKSNADYIMPFDGNCFLNKHAFQEIRDGVAKVEDQVNSGAENKTFKYFAVGMARMQSNDPLKDPDFSPPTAYEEPQLIFHRTAKERFNEDMRYGKRPKVEMLWRLQVKGAWDKWTPKYGPWAAINATYSDDVPGTGGVQRVGWVARLFSGMAELEEKGAANDRGKTRSSGVENLVAEASRIWAERQLGFTKDTLMWYDEKVLESNREAYKQGADDALTSLVKTLREMADRELKNDAEYTVTHKPKAAPSGDLHDYLSAAPYYWPNPDTEDGYPYVRRDGERAPGTQLYGPKSEMYDRSRLASFTRNCTVLALAGYFTGEKQYYDKAARQIRTWFIDNETRMNPNLKYGQVIFRSKKTLGSRLGLIDFVNIAIVLDSVRILQRAGALSDGDMEKLQVWFSEYSEFLSDSSLARSEYRSGNNHGTLFDVQAASVNAFIGDFRQLLWHTSFSRLRIPGQFAADGSMPHEMTRKTQLHYMMYGLQAWVWLARISERLGVNMWEFGRTKKTEPYFMRGMKFCVPYFSQPGWTHKEAGTEDMSRMLFLYFHGKEKYPDLTEFIDEGQHGEHVVPVPNSVFDAKPVLHDYYLVPPFWNLAMKPAEER